MEKNTPISSNHSDDITVSFEFFPPKTEKAQLNLWNTIEHLKPLSPKFVSVTYGAGGSTRKLTYDTIKRIINETNLTPAAHLTCIGASKDEIKEILLEYWNLGVKHLVALRGDPPAGIDQKYTPHHQGYKNAADLTKGVKSVANFEIAVAAYPEKHPDSKDFNEDIDMLKAKVDAGATSAITQFFFDNNHFYDYLNKVRQKGINIPITPGILPILNFEQTKKFAHQCQAKIPSKIIKYFEGLENDPKTRELIATAITAEQINDLMENGIRDFHFFTLNRSKLIYAICHLMGIRPNNT